MGTAVHIGDNHSVLNSTGPVTALPAAMGAHMLPIETPGKVQAIQRDFQNPISLPENCR